ncbi:hypothetical protein [Paenibacillus sp. FSL R7-0333]|uniref:hypothetical protein n=1 Tax=Paenibacillus sp. FSL R7-0333 TaxID=1926587 RepID=UPI00096C1C51|nr:hypothetical protein BK146_18020 [Paenibacillus sp. FSL R7-0333]
MKKYIVGFLAGTVFAISATAFADTIPSLIGKKVQAQYTVEVNGKILNTVVVDGSNYAPVRAFSEAAGYDITAEGKNVKLSEVKAVDSIKPLPTFKYTKDELEKEIKYYENMIQGNQEAIDRVKELVASGKYSDAELSDVQNRLERSEKDLVSDKARLAELQAQLAEMIQK